MTFQEQSIGDVESNTLSQEDLDRKPWKYIGYKGFSRYVSCSDDFLALRRYDRLHCRVLLTLQDRVAELEEELDLLDNSVSRKSSPDIDNGTIRRDHGRRKELLQEISKALKDYDDMLCRYLTLKSKPRAPKAFVKNMMTWLDNNNGPIHPKEVEFLKSNDLITVSKTQKSALRYLFEQWVLCPTMGIFGWLADKPHANEPQHDPSTVYGSDEPVDAIASGGVFIVGAIMLIIPLWILAIVEDMFRRLAIITAFIALLLMVLTSATLAKPFEILATTAGYSAVLVVFLQIGSSTNLS